MRPTPSPEPHRPDPPLDSLLRARLQSTSPAFERRFDDLRRRLAHIPPPAQAPGWLGGFFGHPLRWSLATAAGLALAVSVISLHERRGRSQAASDFTELVLLDDRLAQAVALTDPVTLEAVVLFTSEP